MSLYRECERLIKAVHRKKASVKNLLMQSKIQNKKVLSALVIETLKYEPILIQIRDAAKLLDNERFLRKTPELTLVLLYDLLIGKGFPKNYTSKQKDAILRYKTSLSAELARIKVRNGAINNDDLLSDAVKKDPLPRYVRVNTLKTKLTDVIEHFKSEGYKYVKSSSCNNQSFFDLIKSLEKMTFTKDIHVSDLLVFSGGTDLHKNVLYERGDIILQDKASCMPAAVLAPPPGSHVIDCCAAPGNKTTHAAALMNNKGKIFAFDLDARRLATMNTLCLKAGALCVETENADFLKIDLTDPKYEKVEYVIVDPSCSGSGIVSRLNSVTDDEKSTDLQRLKKLSNFQTTILKHAFTLPNVKMICYSTCSVHEEENEKVVEEILVNHGDKFKLNRALSTWGHRGNERFKGSDCCLRASPDVDLTNGFFVACFVRKGSDRDDGEEFIFEPSKYIDVVKNSSDNNVNPVETDSIVDKETVSNIKRKINEGPEKIKIKENSEDVDKKTVSNKKRKISEDPEESIKVIKSSDYNPTIAENNGHTTNTDSIGSKSKKKKRKVKKNLDENEKEVDTGNENVILSYGKDESISSDKTNSLSSSDKKKAKKKKKTKKKPIV